MKRTLIFVALIGLSGCANISADTKADAVACTSALLSAAIANPSPVAALALLTPECKSLAKEALDIVVAYVQKELPLAKAGTRRIIQQ